MDKAQNRETKKCLVSHLSFLLVLCVRAGGTCISSERVPGLTSAGFVPDGFQSLLRVGVQRWLVKF